MHKIKEIYGVPLTSSPAAAATLMAHFEDTGRTPEHYDLIVTGDLGELGYEITCDILKENGLSTSKYNDCGLIIFDNKKQDTHSGGSGCGCSALVLCAYILDEMKKKTINRVLFAGTGALMSPLSTQQGESIPSIAHAVAISNER